MPLGQSYAESDYLQNSLTQLKGARPSEEAMRLANLRGYRVKRMLDLSERNIDQMRGSSQGQSPEKTTLPQSEYSSCGRPGAGRHSFQYKPGDVGWGVTAYRDADQPDRCRILKPHVRGFDKKRSEQFVYQQDGFSAALDKKLGLQYSDKFSIRHMRDEVFAVMRHINKQGRYSQHVAKKLGPSRREWGPDASKGELLNVGANNTEIMVNS